MKNFIEQISIKFEVFT